MVDTTTTTDDVKKTVADAATTAAHTTPADAATGLGRGVHSSTSQLNVSAFYSRRRFGLT
jgi:hypothetical protein